MILEALYNIGLGKSVKPVFAGTLLLVASVFWGVIFAAIVFNRQKK